MVISCPDELNRIKNVVVTENVGIFPQHNVPHGNNKTAVGDYVCTSCSVKQNIADMIATNKKPREIYEELALDSSSSAPRDLKQVQNAKYITSKKMRIDKGHTYQNNLADEVQALLTDIHKHPFIQEIVQTKGKPPRIILYLEDSLNDIKQFCSSNARNPSALGIDRTFNLGACFATTLVYQHNNLKRKGTDNSPIMLAAIYLHWDGSYGTYHRFFAHLQSKLGTDISGTQSRIVIGSDREAALTMAIKQCFPSAVQLLCTRHLQEKVRRYLCNKVGANKQIKKKIIKDIFGKDSLTTCSDVKEFELKYLELLDKYATRLPLFKNYFEKFGQG